MAAIFLCVILIVTSRGLTSEDLKFVNQKNPPPDIEKNIQVWLHFLPYVVMEVGNGLSQELFPLQ